MGDGKNITYRELDLLSGKVYRYLKDHGIGREDFVNIILPRGVEPFCSFLCPVYLTSHAKKYQNFSNNGKDDRILQRKSS